MQIVIISIEPKHLLFWLFMHNYIYFSSVPVELKDSGIYFKVWSHLPSPLYLGWFN